MKKDMLVNTFISSDKFPKHKNAIIKIAIQSRTNSVTCSSIDLVQKGSRDHL